MFFFYMEDIVGFVLEGWCFYLFFSSYKEYVDLFIFCYIDLFRMRYWYRVKLIDL